MKQISKGKNQETSILSLIDKILRSISENRSPVFHTKKMKQKIENHIAPFVQLLQQKEKIDEEGKIARQKEKKQLINHFEEYRKGFFVKYSTFDEWYEKVYLEFFENREKKALARIQDWFSVNIVGHSAFFLNWFYSENFRKEASPLLKKMWQDHLATFSFPNICPTKPRFFLSTVQYDFYPFLTPSSLALQQTQWSHNLQQNQQKVLRQIHRQKKLDKTDYNGAYGVYFQLQYRTLQSFGPYTTHSFQKRNNLYVFDAETLLSHISEEIRQFPHLRIEHFIYFNPGWFFGKYSKEKTISFQTVDSFLLACQPLVQTSDRNEVVFRWFIPLHLRYGLVGVFDP